MHIQGNYCDDTYVSAFITFTGGNSEGNFYGVNDCDEVLWPSAPRDEIPFRFVIPNTTGGYTDAYAAILPVHAADPTEVSSFGIKERGLMWVRDNSAGTEAIRYFNLSDAASGVALT
jgi:hypothetical protein